MFFIKIAILWSILHLRPLSSTSCGQGTNHCIENCTIFHSSIFQGSIRQWIVFLEKASDLRTIPGLGGPPTSSIYSSQLDCHQNLDKALPNPPTNKLIHHRVPESDPKIIGFSWDPRRPFQAPTSSSAPPSSLQRCPYSTFQHGSGSSIAG